MSHCWLESTVAVSCFVVLGCNIAKSEGQGSGAVRAALPQAQQLVAVGPVWAHRAVGGGRGAVGVAGGAAAGAGRLYRGRARTGGPRGAVGAFRASIGGAGEGAAVVVNVIPLRDR